MEKIKEFRSSLIPIMTKKWLPERNIRNQKEFFIQDQSKNIRFIPMESEQKTEIGRLI